MAQFGSALEWGSRGRRFKSSYPDQRRRKAYSERKSDKVPTFFYFIKFYFRLIATKELSIKYRLKRGPRKTARFLGLFSACGSFFPKILLRKSSFRFSKNLTSQKLIQIFVSPNFCKAYSERKSDKVPTFFFLPPAAPFSQKSYFAKAHPDFREP